jgi:hypothetical protein
MIQKPKHRQLLCHSSYYASTNKHSDLKAISISVSGERRKWPHHSQIHLSVLMLNGCIVVTPRSISIFFWDSMTTWQLDNLIHPISKWDLWHFYDINTTFRNFPSLGIRRGHRGEQQPEATSARWSPRKWPWPWARHRVDGTVSMAPVVQRWGDFPMDFPIPVRLRMMAI